MGGARRTATDTLTERILPRVDEELTAAALARWDGAPEVFLWRSRRCVEAMLYVLLIEAKVDVTQLAEQNKGIEGLSKHDKLQGVLTREMRNHVESVQKYGNTATHFQVEGPAGEASAEIAAKALVELARWFYERSGQLPERLEPTVAALTDPTRRLLGASERALDEERRRNRELTQQLHVTRRPALVAADAPPLGDRRFIGFSVGIALTAAVVSFTAGRATRGPDETITEPAPLAPTPVQAGVGPVTSPEHPATPPAEASPPPVPPPTPPAEPPRCPPTMQLIPARGDVAAFCIDRDLVLEGDYRRCVNDPRRCDRPGPATEDGCNWQNGAPADGYAANCLSWALARDYCQRTHGAGASLPARAEWQAAAAARPVLRVRADTQEWSEDSEGPGQRLVRGGAGSVTWAPAPEGRGRRHIGFRCVLRAAR